MMEILKQNLMPVANFEVLNTFFDHIYVITLKRATNRQEEIRRHLEGLNYSFFTGADKNDFKVETLVSTGIYDEKLAIRNHRYKKPMRPGQIGCSWSHRMVYEDVLAKGYKKVLILEDDVQIHPALLPSFEKALSELPPDWELLYLDYAKNERANFSKSMKQSWYHTARFFGGIRYTHKTIGNMYPRPFSHNLRISGLHDYTDAYAITDVAAGKLLKLQTPVQYIADNLLSLSVTNGIIKGFILIQKLFTQNSQGENAGESYVDEEKPGKNHSE